MSKEELRKNEKTGTKCGQCGKELTYETDAHNGYCHECSEKYDK